MHVPLFVLLAFLTVHFWAPVVIFGSLSIVVCWLILAPIFLGLRWGYRRVAISRPDRAKEE